MKREEIINKIKNYCTENQSISFALIFGSFCNGNILYPNDLDIGLYTKDDISLLKIGKINVDLQELSGMKIDTVILNGIYKKDPKFAYEILHRHILLYAKKKSEYIDFKRETFLYYFDMKTMLDFADRSFVKRLRSHNFGKYNYVR